MMRKAVVWARGALVRQWPDLVQVGGIAVTSWGLYGLRPWLGKVVGGLLAGAYGVVLERTRTGA